MLFGLDRRLDDLVVEMLLDAPGTAAAALQEKLSGLGEQNTIQALYYTLTRLEDAGIIYKLQRRYFVRPSWLLKMKVRAERCLQAYPENPFLLPTESKAEWKLKSLAELHSWWSNVTTTLFGDAAVREYYEWVPHVWFHLSSTGLEDQVLESHAQRSVPYYLLVGSDSYLDRSYLDLRSRVEGVTRFFASPPDRLRSAYISVLGAYTITITLDEKLSQHIDELFSSVRQAADFDPRQFERLKQKKSTINFLLERNEAKALAMAEQFRLLLSEHPAAG